MIDTTLPMIIYPQRFAKERRQFEGYLPLASLNALDGLLVDNGGEALVSLQFDVDRTQNRIILTGQLQAEILLCCQRCLEPCCFALKTTVQWSPAADEDDAALIDLQGYAPVMVGEDGALHLSELIGAEIVLNIPIVPAHNVNECSFNIN